MVARYLPQLVGAQSRDQPVWPGDSLAEILRGRNGDPRDSGHSNRS